MSISFLNTPSLSLTSIESPSSVVEDHQIHSKFPKIWEDVTLHSLHSDEATDQFCSSLGFEKNEEDYLEGGGAKIFFVKDLKGKCFVYKRINKSYYCSAMNIDKFLRLSAERGESFSLLVPNHESIIETFGLFVYNERFKNYRYVKDLENCTVDDFIIGIIEEHFPDSKDLYYFSESMIQFSEEQLRKIGKGVGEALAFLHQNNILHRDIKMENVLIDPNFEVKLIDFGFARFLKEGERTRTLCFTKYAVSPEMALLKPYTNKVDVWAFGILMYELAFGRLPFSEDNIFKEIKDFAHFKRKMEKEDFPQWPSHSKEFIDLMEGIFIYPPEERLSMDQVLAHPFFKAQGVNQLNLSFEALKV